MPEHRCVVCGDFQRSANEDRTFDGICTNCLGLDNGKDRFSKGRGINPWANTSRPHHGFWNEYWDVIDRRF